MDLEKLKVEAGVFDRTTLLVLYKLLSDKVFSRLDARVSEGKESVVFRASNKESLAVKIHRVETSNFVRMWKYIEGDPRFKGVKKSKRSIVYAWARKEYSNLKKAHEAGVHVPRPVTFLKNVLVMKFLGNEIPAPRLRDVSLRNPKKVFNVLVQDIKKLYQTGLVHADLSEYNVLMLNERPYIIDFGAGVLLDHPFSKDFLLRDIRNIAGFFERRYGLPIDPEEIYSEICKR